MESNSSGSSETTAPRQPEYVGFWKRLLAFVIDVLILTVVSFPILLVIYGSQYFSPDRLLSGQTGAWDWVLQLLAAVAGILFWRFRGATPGKIAISARIVDAKTFGPPDTGRLIARMLAYLVSFPITLGLGFLWIAFDRRKQGFHDKLAGTVVVEEDD